MKVFRSKWPRIVLCLTAFTLFCVVAAPPSSGLLELDLRQLRKMDTGVDQWEQVTNHARWEPSRTAVVICDMWNQHWCNGATARVAEMAPRMNDVITELRRRGVLIIHCPSETMDSYRDSPGRRLAQSAPKLDLQPIMENNLARQPKTVPALPRS